MKRKILSILLSLLMAVTCFPLSIVHALPEEETHVTRTVPTISVESIYAKAGKTVNVNVNISGNTGIAGAQLTISYDEGLTLIGAASGAAFAPLDYTEPSSFASPCSFNWDSEGAVATEDGAVLTLNFTIDAGVSSDENLAVNVSYVYGDIYDVETNSIAVNTQSGYIDVIDFIYGDVNNDDTINGKDVTLIRRHNAGYSVTINEAAADVNCDGRINGKDVTLIRRYNAGWPVTLPTVPPNSCNHNMEHVEAVPATCTEDGNVEYWHCTVCGKYFSDPNGAQEITQESTVVHATGHSFSNEWTYDATYHWHASTCGHDVVSDRAEHTFNANGVCTVCGASSNTPDPTKPYTVNYLLVEYNVNQGDAYIATQAIDNSQNTVYFSATDSFDLYDVSCPGYEFLGWFTPDGVRMTRIPAGTDHDVTLYARWREIVYNVTYRVYLTPVAPVTEDRYIHYTVSQGLPDLPNPTINNYEFIGWYTDEGAEVTRLPVGTTGNLVLNAYFTSYRNMAKKVASLDDPTIVVDTNNGWIYFAYELGTIENVPLSPAIWTIQGVSGLIEKRSETVTSSITESQAYQVSEMLTNTTTNSGTWTLSENWNDTTHVDEGWAQQHGMTTEEAETRLRSTSDSYSITTSNGGSGTTTTNTGTTTVNYNSRNNEFGGGAKLYSEQTEKYSESAKIYAEVEAPGFGKAGAEAEVGLEYGGKTGGEYTSNHNANLHSGSDQTVLDTTTTSSTSSWNNSSTASQTQQASESHTSSQLLSEVLSSTYNVGQEYIHGNSQTEQQGFSSSDSQSVNSSTTFTYSKIESTTVTREYSTDGKSDGWYRLVIAGRLHVFGVVGYDVATRSYFVYTFSLMEDDVYDFLDYSPYSSFDDNEYCALPFNVPDDIYNYVNRMTSETEGLLFRTNTNEGTATVVGYTGTDTDVLIPSFYSNGGNSYRVTGMSTSAFAGKNIRAIALSEYMDEIPAGAFKNCTSLESVYGRFTRIGSEAFSGCTSLTDFNISSCVTSVGANAFAGVSEISADVLNEAAALDYARKQNPDISDEDALRAIAAQLTENVADEIIASGANRISIDLSRTIGEAVFTLNVPSIESFDLNGGKRVFTDLKLDSNAGTTAIRNIKIKDCTRIPLVIASDIIILDTVTVNSQSFALIAKSQNVSISMIRDNTLSSASGNAVVCKNPTLVSEVTTRAVVGYLDVSGNMYVCGNPPIVGSEYLEITNGEVIYINDEQFNSLIRGYFTVTFDPNGGSVLTPSKNVEFGANYGELPVPERATYDFIGWFTEPEGGTQITADTASSAIYDQTLYAHWELKQYTVYFDANGGSCETESIPAVIGNTPSALPTPTRTGFTFNGWYTAASGGTQVTLSNWNSVISGMDPAALVNNGLHLYAHWTVNSYTVNWSGGTGYSITVTRTGSPNAGAAVGNLNSGATVYYGDELSIIYSPATGYSVTSHGLTQITITGDVGSSSIYATASANSYTYNIVYRSVNGTSLGSATRTEIWGTTVTIGAPDKSGQGYTTPAAQTVTWDSTSPKTITFTYGIASVSNPTKYGAIGNLLDYSAVLEYRNRTASTVEVRIVWTTTIHANSWTVYGQVLNAWTNAASSNVQIAAAGTWKNQVSYARSATGSTNWMVVNLNTTNSTTAAIGFYYYQCNYNGLDMYQYDGTAHVEGTWYVNVPAY